MIYYYAILLQLLCSKTDQIIIIISRFLLLILWIFAALLHRVHLPLWKRCWLTMLDEKKHGDSSNDFISAAVSTCAFSLVGKKKMHSYKCYVY